MEAPKHFEQNVSCSDDFFVPAPKALNFSSGANGRRKTSRQRRKAMVRGTPYRADAADVDECGERDNDGGKRAWPHALPGRRYKASR